MAPKKSSIKINFFTNLNLFSLNNYFCPKNNLWAWVKFVIANKNKKLEFSQFLLLLELNLQKVFVFYFLEKIQKNRRLWKREVKDQKNIDYI